MEKKRIVWVDDDIKTSILKPYVDEFEDRSVEIIKVESVEGLIEILKKEAQNSLDAILVDIIMPPENLDFGETRGGLRTGIVVLNRILKEDAFKSILIVAVTNVDDDKVVEYCKKNKILCLKKEDYFTDIFVDKIIEEIIKSKNGEQ